MHMAPPIRKGPATPADTVKKALLITLVVLAAVALLASLVVAERSGNGLIIAADTVLVVVALSPVWLKRPRWLLIALVLFLPFQDALLHNLTSGRTVTRVIPDALLLVALVVMVALSYPRRQKLVGGMVALPVVFLLAVALVSMILNHIHPSQAAQGPYVMLRYAVVFYLAANSAFTESEVHFLIKALVVVAMIQVLITFVQFVLLNSIADTVFGYPLPTGTMDAFNALGAFLALVCVLVMAVYRPSWTKRAEFVILTVVFLGSLGIGLATSRQSILSLLIGIAMLVVFDRSRASLFLTAKAALMALGGLTLESVIAKNLPDLLAPLAAQFGGGNQAARLAHRVELKAQQLTLDRLLNPDFDVNSRLFEIVKGGEAILKASPLFGLGPGTFGSQATWNDIGFYRRLGLEKLFSHKDSVFVADVEWISIFGQLGILGVLGFLWLFLALFRTGYRVWRHAQSEFTRRLGLASLVFVPMFLVLGWFGPNFEIRPVSILMWLIPGLALGLYTQEKRAAERRASVIEPVAVTTDWLSPESTLARIIATRGKDAVRLPPSNQANQVDQNGMSEWNLDRLQRARICMVNGQFFPHIGGAERAMQRRAQQLRTLGYQTLVVTYRIQRAWAREEYVDETRVVRTGGLYVRGRLVRRWGLAVAPMLRRLLRERNHYDIIHAQQMLEPAFAAVLAGKLLRKPVVIKIASVGKGRGINQLSGTQGIPGRLMQRSILRSKAIFIALASETVRELQEAGIPRERIRWIPNGVDIERFPARSWDTEEGQQSQLPRHGICVARLAHVKGVDVLVRAWPRVVARASGAQLTLLGDGPDRALLERLARELGVTDSVEFAGETHDVAPRLAQADFFVLPSRGDSFSNAVLEAMASGLPVVTTAAGGALDLIEDGVNGLLAMPDDPDSLAEKLLMLMTTPGLGQRLAQQARRQMEEEYTQEIELVRYIQTYEDLVPSQLPLPALLAENPHEPQPPLDLAPGAEIEQSGEYAVALEASGEHAAVGKKGRSVNVKIFLAMVSLASTTVVARLLGVVNQIVISAFFGAGRAMDAYFGSLEVPTVLTNITVNGLNVAVTPAYARLVHHQREDEASEVLSSILNVFVIVLTILTAVMIVLPRLVVRIFAPGLSTETVDIAATLIPLLVPTLVINVLIGFMTNILSVKDKFALPALSVILVPFATLVFTLVAGREIGVRAVAAGFLAGTVIQLFVMILLMRRAGVHYRFALHLRHPEVRRVVGQLWPMLVGASLVQVNSLVDQIIGSFFGVGSVSALNYAGKVINVPVGVLFLAGSRAVLPYFSRQVAAHDIQGLKNSLRIFAWLVGGLSLGISVIFIAFSGLIVKVLFQRGEFSESDAALTAAVLIGFSVGLCPMALEFMIPRVFSALHRNQILLGVTTFTLLANVILDLAFAYGFGVPGIALATSIDYIFTTALLLILLRREIGPLGLLRPPIDVLLRARRRGSTKAKPAGAESVASRL